LRIISGYAKGLKLKGPHGQAIRPTSDRAREALFNIISSRVRNASVLDLFAGTGALGLEALSRGAGHVTFVDNDPNALLLIKKNLQILEKMSAFERMEQAQSAGALTHVTQKSAAVIKFDLRRKSFFLNKARTDHPPFFDLIFLDPPYEKGLSLQTLTYLDQNAFLARHGLLIAEDRAGIELPDSFSTLTIMDKRRYGDTGFWFYCISGPQ
jgi:16S rRNA (guanine966-N2)-methyltransferase